MEPTPEHIVMAAHRHERYAQAALGLSEADVERHAPPELRNTGTRAAYVEGLRRALAHHHHRASAHVAMADALYWCLAQKSVASILRSRRAHMSEHDDGMQEGMLWLHKAAQRFVPGAGPWRRYAVSWLKAGAWRRRDRLVGVLSNHDRGLRRRVVRAAERAAALGKPATRAELALVVGCTTADIERVLVEPHFGADAPGLAELRVTPDEGLDVRLDVDQVLARLTPTEAWALARQAGLWDTPTASWQQIGTEMGVTVHKVRCLLTQARARGAAGKARSEAALWPFDRRGLRWAVQTTAGVAITDIALNEGLPRETVEDAVVAFLEHAGVQARPRRERVA